MSTFNIGDKRSITDGSSQQFDVDPVFLLATERSGSNLARSILNAHPDLTAPHPLETAYPWRSTAPPAELSASARRRLIRDILLNKNYSYQPLVETLDITSVQCRVETAEVPSYLTVQEALYDECVDSTDARRWVSKDPGQWHCLDEILEYYDDPQFVYLVRDARDTALSFKNSNVGQYHPYLSAERWREEQRAGRHLLEAHEDRVHLLRYRDLLQDPETEVEEVCSFLDIPFEERMLYYYDTNAAQQGAEQSATWENLSIPIQSDNYAKFHDGLTGEEIKIVEAVAGEELTAFGFDLVNDEQTLSNVELDAEAYEEAESMLAQQAALKYWQENAREQFHRSLSQSFSIYMILRYGMLA